MQPASREDDAARQAARRARIEAIARANYAGGLLDGIASMIGPGDVVCDCGANVGKVTAVLAASGATVHAFEPDPHALTILRDKFAGTPNVILHDVAVGDEAGMVTFYRSSRLDDNADRSPQGNTLYKQHHAVKKGAQIEIQVRMIDFAGFVSDLLDSGHRVPFVKIDVEGAELGILRRMLDLSLFERIKLTVAETHEANIPTLAREFALLRADIAARYPKNRVNLDWI